MPTIEELGQKVKGKYPGVYDDLSDSELGQRVKAKYPQEYADFGPTGPKEPFADYQPMGTGEKVLAAAKHLGSAAISPIAGIPDAISAVGEFLKNPNAWARKHFNAEEARVAPGAMGSDPIAESAPVIMPVAAGVVAGDVAPAVSRAASAVKDVATSPGVVRSLDRAGNYAIAGGAAGLHPGSALTGIAVKAGAELLRRAGERATEVPQIYEDLAQSLAKKSFKNLDAAGQQTIRDLAQRVQATPASSPLVAETPAVSGTSGVASPERGVSGTATSPAMGSGSPREVASPNITPVKGLARASADANALTQKLIEWGSTPDEVLGMNKAGWEKLAADAGVSKFPSEATIRATLYNLKKILAGPKRTPMEALEALKASLADMETAPKPTPMRPEAIDIAKALKSEMERSGTISKPNVRRRIR